MTSTKSQHQLSAFPTLLFAYLGHCATSPTAYISLALAPPYATMRPCAASCLVYRGIWSCPFNSGYYDLGIELSCGCNPQNFCYCDSKAAASASSYISSCVNAGCGAEFPGEVTSAMDLYNGYCATVNVAALVQTTAPSVTLSTSSKSTPAANSSNRIIDADANSNGPSSTSRTPVTAETSAPQTSSANSEKKGLQQSDVIALAVGLGVGFPSLLLALATFCLQRKRKERQNRVTTETHYVK